MLGHATDGTAVALDVHGTPVGARWFGQSSFARHCIASAANAVQVDKTLPLWCLGPLGCGIQTGAGAVMMSLDVQDGESIAIFGAGAVGLAAVMAAKVVGAACIIAVDTQPNRLEMALQLGATHVIQTNSTQSKDLVKQVSKAAGRDGLQYALDTTGAPDVMLTALKATRFGGTVGFVGVAFPGTLKVDMFALMGKTVKSIFEGDANPHEFIPRLIDLWTEGRFPFDQLIKTFRLEEINDAEQASTSGSVIKPVLLMGTATEGVPSLAAKL